MTTFIMMRWYTGKANFFIANVPEIHIYPNGFPSLDYAYGADVVIRVLKDGTGKTIRRSVSTIAPKEYYSADEILMLALQATVVEPNFV